MKSRVISAILFVTVIATAFCLVGCGKSQTYSVGETVETDVVSFTLDRAELAIALENSMGVGLAEAADGVAGGNFFLPKEYDANDDAKNPFVAAKGHTLISMTFTVKNLDRSSVELCDWGLYQFITIKYNGNTYTGKSSSDDNFKSQIGAINENDEGWRDIRTSQIYVYGGEATSYKVYIDIPTETESLSSPFEITFALPTSSGETQSFTYAINQ